MAQEIFLVVEDGHGSSRTWRVSELWLRPEQKPAPACGGPTVIYTQSYLAQQGQGTEAWVLRVRIADQIETKPEPAKKGSRREAEELASRLIREYTEPVLAYVYRVLHDGLGIRLDRTGHLTSQLT